MSINLKDVIDHLDMIQGEMAATDYDEFREQCIRAIYILKAASQLDHGMAMYAFGEMIKQPAPKGWNERLEVVVRQIHALIESIFPPVPTLEGQDRLSTTNETKETE
jgi:hypothetical protein